MDNNSEYNIAKLNQKTSVITTTVTVVSSLLGSLIVALIVGHLTIRASVESTILSNQAQEDLLKQTIESQLSIASKANDHQEMIAIKTMENSLIIAERSLKNAIDVIERDSELRHKEKVEQERRARLSEKIYSMNYLLSDIGLRTLSFEVYLNDVESYVEKITKSGDDAKTMSRLIVELEMKQNLNTHEVISWPISQDVYKQTKDLTPKLQSKILLFYRLIEKHAYFSGATNSKEATEYRNSIKQLISSNTASQNEKELLLKMYQTMSVVNISASKNMLRQILILGFRNMVDLHKELNIEDKEIVEKLLKYEKLYSKQDETYFSSMKRLFEQIDRVQIEILEKRD